MTSTTVKPTMAQLHNGAISFDERLADAATPDWPTKDPSKL
jgi:hypothetical protein